MPRWKSNLLMRTMNGTDVFCFSKHCCAVAHTDNKTRCIFATALLHKRVLLWRYFQQRFISTANDLENYIKYELLAHPILFTTQCVGHIKPYMNKYGWQACNTHTHNVQKMFKDIVANRFGKLFLEAVFVRNTARAADCIACSHSSKISQGLIWGWIWVVRLMRNFCSIALNPLNCHTKTLDSFR